MNPQHFITNLTGKSYRMSKPDHELVFDREEYRFFLFCKCLNYTDIAYLFDISVGNGNVDAEAIVRWDGMINDKNSFSDFLRDFAYDLKNLSRRELDMLALLFRMPKNRPDIYRMGLSLLDKGVCRVFVREVPDIHACVYDLVRNEPFGDNEEGFRITKDILLNIMRALTE